MRRTLWLTLLLLCVAVAPRVAELAPCADGWEQLDETQLEALPVTMSAQEVPDEEVGVAWARCSVRPVQIAGGEIFRPPIG